ncbi:hypothetical protein JCM3765_007910, partial [Sporobolomyces pararoseus]
LSRLSASSILSFLDSLFYSLPSTSSTTITHYDKCQVLSIPSTVERIEFGIKVLSRVEETLKAVNFDGDKVDPTGMTKRQREYALMQQLLAIKQELDSIHSSESTRSPTKSSRKRFASASNEEEEEGEVDELAELGKKIEEKAFSEEARKVALREFKRLKKSPPQGAEYGVIRELTYIVYSSRCEGNSTDIALVRARSTGTYLETLLSIPWT